MNDELKESLLNEARNSSNGRVLKTFQASGNGLIFRDTLLDMESDGLITIHRKATGMIDYSLND